MFDRIYLKIYLPFLFPGLIIISSCKKNHAPNPVPTPVITQNLWIRETALPAGKFIALKNYFGQLFALSASAVVYRSLDKGITWTVQGTVKQGITPTCLAVFNNTVFVGTDGDGIFSSSDEGADTWLNDAATNPTVSSFAVWNNNLYSSSSVEGIFAYNWNTNKWSHFNSAGQPTNYSTDVEKVIDANQSLITAQGPNGTFYNYNSTANAWAERYYFSNTYKPGYTAQDIIYDCDKNKLLVSFGPAVLSSTYPGTNWSYDTVGLKKVVNSPNYLKSRILFSGNGNYYIVSNSVSGGAWIQSRRKTLPTGASWALNDDYLQLQGWANDFLDLKDFEDILFVATDNGLYYKIIG